MERMIGNVMNVSIGGPSGNDNDNNTINVQQSIQSNEQSTKVKLTELPRKVLEYIMIHLQCKDLLTISLVCKLFASILETAIERKYANEYYCVQRDDKYNDSGRMMMLNKYGGKLHSIWIKNYEEKVLDLVERKCSNLERIILYRVPRIITLKNMKEVSLVRVGNLSRETFVEFINNNHQLEYLHLEEGAVDFLVELDDQLNMLRTLSLVCNYNLLEELPKIRLKSLETLNLHPEYCNETFVSLFGAMNCNPVKKIWLSHRCNGYESDDESDNKSDDFIDEICKFKTLSSLCIPDRRITSDQIRKIADHLPHLDEFSMTIADDEPNLLNVMHLVLLLFPKLKYLAIELGPDHFIQFLNELKESVTEFHARFTRANTEIQLKCHPDKVSITKDRLLMKKLGSKTWFFWMENLVAAHVRKEVNKWFFGDELTFVNYCADRAFDIGALGNAYTKCLTFSSSGPLTVNTITSRYHILFPCLKILKIYLEQHSMIDFLRNVDAIFCEQIEELWLNTRYACDDPHMMTIMGKFKNLKSLHLSSSAIKCDLGHLLSVCPNLNEIKRIP